MTLTSVKKDAGVSPSEGRKHPVLRKTLMICAAFAFVALAVLVLGVISADESYADDVVVDGATYTTNGNTATLKFAPVDAVDFTIPEKVTYNSYTYTVNKVSDSAFVSCDLLETLTISSKNRCFGATINFYQCTSLREFIIGPGVTYYVVDDSGALIDTYYDSTYGRMILGYPLARPLADNSYTIPSNVKSVGPDAFRNVPIQSLTIPSSVVYIRSYAFYGNAIQNLTIPGTVHTIETYAFSSPTTQKVVIEEGVVSIAKYAFGCPTASDSNITDLTVPVSIYNNMRTDESQRYINTSKLQSITFTGTGLLEMPTSYSSTVKPHYLSRTVLQEVNIGPGITGLANNFLDSFPELTTVNIADNPDRTGFSVGDYTFRACKKLTNIDTSVFTSIGNSAFVDAGLQTITLSSAVTSIGDRAFQRSDSASSKTATIYYNCENASYAGTNYAFNYGMDSTSTVIIGSTVKQIPDYLFKKSSSIISMTNNKVLQTIGSDSFMNCTVSDLVLPNTIVSISEDAFTGATVTNLTVPGTVPTVNQYTFPKVINLTYLSDTVSHYYVSQYTLSLDIGYYVTAIDDQVFSKGRNITTITVDEESDYFWFRANDTMLFYDTDSSIIWYCGTAESVEIPTNVEKIGLYAFYGHDELKSIQLSPSLNVIGESAFEGTGLTAVRLPDTVAIIGAKAFFEARSLAKITIADDDDFSSIGADAFNTKYSTDPTFYSMFVVNSHNQKIDLTTRFPSIYGETVVNTENNVPGDITTPVAAGNLEFTFIGGVLTINSTTRGTEMDAYTETNLPPWAAIRGYITEIVIGDGVTKICTYGIADYPNCTKLTLGKALRCESGYFFAIQNLPNLELLTYRMVTSSTTFQNGSFVNVGVGGFKILFQSDDGVSMYVPHYMLYGNPINVTELEFDVGNNLLFGNYCMYRTENVSKIIYNVKGYVARNGGAAIGITDYLGDNVDSVELVIGANMAGFPGNEYIGNNISKVTILSNNITTIANSAFKNNTKITAITIPASCTAIGSYAFEGCTALETVIISSVTGDERFQVGVNTFKGCVALKSIDLSRATSIGNNAFYGCTSLECDLDLSNATSIGTQAFSGADADGAPQLGDVVLKDNVWLGEAAFRYSGASFGTVTISPETKWGGDGYYFGGCSVKSFIIDYSTASPSNMFKDIVSDFTMVLKKTPNDFNAGSNPHLGAVTLDSSFSWIKVTSTTTSPLTSAFGFCDRLGTVTINKQIVLGSSAFRGCTRLSTVNGFDNITEFEDWSFDGCQSLFFNKGTIEFNGKTIGDRAFRNTSLTGVRLINCTIWNGTTTAYPFGDCPITSVEYTWNLNSADTTKLWWVMKDTTRDYTLTINGLSIPDVTSVEGANGGLHLTKVVIGSGVTGCADSARFTGCVNLSEIVYNTSGIPANTFDSSESGPFRGLTQSIAVSVGASASVPNYMFKGLKVSNALTINNGTTIGSYAFASTFITGVIIPSYSTIGDYAFSQCGSLTAATVNGTPSLGTGIFQNCGHLATVTFNGTPTSIPARMFEGCSALTGSTIPSTVTSISEYAFSGSGLSGSLSLHSGLVSIGNNAFSGCIGLTGVAIPLSVTSIGNNAFSGCSNVAAVTIMDWESSNEAQRLTIGIYAFDGTSISSITIPERTSTIDSYAFKDTEISIVDIPETVTQMGSGIFSGAPLALVILHGTTIGSGDMTFIGTSVVTGTPSEHGFIARIVADEDSEVTIAARLFEGSSLRKVEFSGRSLAVRDFAFSSCLKLTEMPDKITSIGQSAFRGCTALKTVVLSNITSGDSYEAFRGCTGIENLTTVGNVSLGTRCFSGCTGFRAVVLSSGTSFDTSTYFPFPDWTFQNTSGSTLSNSQIAGKAFYYTNGYLRQCYQVSFDVLGLADSILPQPIFPSSPRAIQPELSNIQTGYRFNGNWYYNDEVWDFSDSIVGDMTLVAGIVAKTYAITVDGGDYGTATLTATYNSNTASLGTGIDRTGYSVKYLLTEAGGSTKVASVAGGNVTFLGNVGQYTDVSGKWIYDIPSAETLTFYVDWAAMRYQQDLIAGTGGVNGTLIVQYDGGIIDYSAPTKSGNSPEGFYIESACTTKVVGFDELGQPYLVPNVTSYTDADGNWILAELTDLYVKWEVMKVHITLQVSSGDPSTDDGHAVATYGESTLQIQDAVRTGYVLDGYYLIPNMDTPLIDADGKLAVLFYSEAIGDNLTDENRNWINPNVYELTLVARWDPITYTIAFDANGGTSEMASHDMTYNVSWILSSCTFAKTGYEFGSWNTRADGNGTRYYDKTEVSNLTTVDEDTVTLYAQWAPITYTVTFNGNTGTSSMDPQEMTYDTSSKLTDNAFTKTGYFFDGWMLSADGDHADYEDGATVSNLATTQDANVDLFARWVPITYEVSFNGNGSTSGGPINNVTLTYDTLQNLPSNTFLKVGHDFEGWKLSADGDHAEFANGGSVVNLASTQDALVQLFAHWTPKVYSIALNNGAGSADPSSVNVTYGGGLASNPQPVRNGYTLTGYYTQSQNGIKVIDTGGALQGKVEGLTDANGKWIATSDEITLYAQWAPRTYEFTLISGEGEQNDGTARVVFGESSFTVITAPSKTGHEVYNYCIGSATGTTIAGAGGALRNNVDGWTDLFGNWNRYEGSMNIYVSWAPKEYTVTLDANGGTISSGTYSIYYGESTTSTGRPAKPTMTGYVFQGFFTEATGGVRVFDLNCNGLVGVEGWTDGSGNWINHSESQTLYAHWNAESIIIILKDPNGDDNGGFEIVYDTDTVSSINVTHPWTGYEYAGFYADADCTVQVIQKVGNALKTVKGVNGWTDADGMWKQPDSMSATLYILWEPMQTALTLAAGDGDTAGSATATYGSAELTGYTAATRTGWSLTGYVDGSSVSVIDAQGHLIANVAGYTDADGKWTYTGSGAPALTAQWEINQYTITFDSAGGSAVDPIVKDYGAAIDAPADPTKSGFTFVAWQPALPATMPAQNMTVTAVWSVLPTPSTDQAIDFNVPGADTVVIDTDVPAIADALDDATKTEVKVEGDGWNMVLPKEIVKDATGAVSFGANVLSAAEIDALPQAVKEKVVGKTVYSLSLSDANGKVTFTGKNVMVTLPYVLKAGESASDVKLFYIDDSNVVHEVVATYDADGKCVVFSTDHFSLWFIDASAAPAPTPTPSSSGGGFNIGLIIGIIVAVVVVAAVVGVVVIKKKA